MIPLPIDALPDYSNLPPNQGFWGISSGANGDVCFPLTQAVHLIRNDNFQLDIGVAPTKLFERCGQQARKQRVGCGDPDGPGELQVFSCKPALNASDILLRPSRDGEKVFSGSAWRVSSARSLKKHHAQLIFQIGEPAEDCRMADSQLPASS